MEVAGDVQASSGCGKGHDALARATGPERESLVAWWGWLEAAASRHSVHCPLVPTVVNALDTPVMISVVTFWHFSPYSHCMAVQSLTLLVEMLPSPTPSLLSSGPRDVTLISFPTGVRGLSSGGHCTSPDSFTPRSSFFWQGVLPPPDLSPLWIH